MPKLIFGFVFDNIYLWRCNNIIYYLYTASGLLLIPMEHMFYGKKKVKSLLIVKFEMKNMEEL